MFSFFFEFWKKITGKGRMSKDQKITVNQSFAAFRIRKKHKFKDIGVSPSEHLDENNQKPDEKNISLQNEGGKMIFFKAFLASVIEPIIHSLLMIAVVFASIQYILGGEKIVFHDDDSKDPTTIVILSSFKALTFIHYFSSSKLNHSPVFKVTILLLFIVGAVLVLKLLYTRFSVKDKDQKRK
jgi:hypothetical protein